MRLTVGPLPPAVYWRRRAIVLGGALLVLFVIFQACSASRAPGEQGASETSAHPTTPEPTGTVLRPTIHSPSPGPTPESGPDVPVGAGDPPSDEAICTDDEMLVTAEADRAEFSLGDRVQFTLWIRNDSDRSCYRDVGGDERELYLRQGTGTTRVWSSRDCQPPTGTELRELPPAFVTKHYIDWNGKASSFCQGAEPAGPTVAPGEYELVARLGSAHSEPVQIVVR